jgi:uncharacterized Zn finger protein
MPKKKSKLNQFLDLSWDDIEEWAGGKIAARGKNYQHEGRVSDLAVTADPGLIAWVDGTDRYATRVRMDGGGLPESECTCPYAIDCKHGVAVVLEYLQRVESKKPIAKAKESDERLKLLSEEASEDEWEDSESDTSGAMLKDIDSYFAGKSKAQLVELIRELAGRFPEVAQEIVDRRQLKTGNTKNLVTRLRHEIQEITHEPGWRNYWDGEGHTPDYSGIRRKFETLLQTGHADAVLSLGQELIGSGIQHVEQSDDEGETESEISACMPVVVAALEQSSLDTIGRMMWALDAVLQDQFEVCEAFGEYLDRRHPPSAWSGFADLVIERLKRFKSATKGEMRDYERDRLSDWAVVALERAGRPDEIIPQCETEASRTGSYSRLVRRLIEAKRYPEAERWIQEGFRATRNKWPGVASDLRNRLREIRLAQKNWLVVAAMQVEDFVSQPTAHAYGQCKTAADKIKRWHALRSHIMQYLEKGELPWGQKGWDLPESGLERAAADRRERFPLLEALIDIAILEKKPESVLRWYDQRPKQRFMAYGIDDNAVATAVQDHAPDRAVAIWKEKAERLIAVVKPSAYQEAAGYLRKAAKVMLREKKTAEWEKYLKALRQEHLRKRRLVEIIDGLDGKPILKKRR